MRLFLFFVVSLFHLTGSAIFADDYIVADLPYRDSDKTYTWTGLSIASKGSFFPPATDLRELKVVADHQGLSQSKSVVLGFIDAVNSGTDPDGYLLDPNLPEVSFIKPLVKGLFPSSGKVICLYYVDLGDVHLLALKGNDPDIPALSFVLRGDSPQGVKIDLSAYKDPRVKLWSLPAPAIAVNQIASGSRINVVSKLKLDLGSDNSKWESVFGEGTVWLDLSSFSQVGSLVGNDEIIYNRKVALVDGLKTSIMAGDLESIRKLFQSRRYEDIAEEYEEAFDKGVVGPLVDYYFPAEIDQYLVVDDISTSVIVLSKSKINPKKVNPTS